MWHKNVLAWKAKRGILVRAALTVSEHGIKLTDKGKPSPLSKSDPPFTSPPFSLKMGGMNTNPQPMTGLPRRCIHFTADGVER